MLEASLPSVDIIIPVFNEPEWAKRCLQSLFDRTTNIDFRIIAIDDCSTNPGITPLLRSMAAAHPERMMILRNPVNEGFVKTANRGMRFSNRDVVLLNTDTEVSTGWLERMANVAYKDSCIASVTPLSSEASIYSIYQSPAGKEFVKGAGVEEIARIITKYSEHQTPYIPTGVGFCLYIKRAALEEIGTFDTAFGRGYGEENDWCMRATKAGWKHILDDGTFVYHEGHVTMRAIGYLKKDQTCLPAHERMLRERYPDFDDRIAAFLEKDTALPTLRRKLQQHCMSEEAKGRRRIAFIVHGAPAEDAIGGTELHVYDLIAEMQKDCDIVVLHPAGDTLCVERYVGTLHDTWSVSMDAADPSIAVAAVLKEFPRDIVHVHHTLDFGFSVLKVAKESGAHVVYSIHDYYPLSPNYTLTDEKGYFHGIPHEKERCLGSQLTHKAWQQNARDGLKYADVIVAPSGSALSIFDIVFKDIACPRRIIPHGIAGNRYSAAGDMRSAPTVCFLGYVHALQKGRNIVEPVIQELARSGVRCIVLGSTAKHFPDLQSPLIQFRGPYQRNDLPSILDAIQPHMIAILSTYPETFCYALSESWQAGIPAYVSNRGALAERMQKTGAGWVSPSQNPKEIAQDIILQLSGPNYRSALKQTHTIHLPSCTDMVNAYRELYDAFGKYDPIAAFQYTDLPLPIPVL
jgi:GT2 family glycosyltransferase/glycosyltransferase involved in cell wall biosynthesis